VSGSVALREVTAETLRAVLALSVSPQQSHYVAPNAVSIAEAHFHPEAWFRAIYVGEEPAGFLMLHDENLKPDPEQDDFYYLWRMMVDERFQGHGVGRTALELLVVHVRNRPGARRLLTSCLPGEHSPEGFYLSCGFERTGVMLDDREIELARLL
jgi:diamine N-acetyltransferase